MAISPDQSLLDLTARTATADSDLIHVNSGGTDYKEEKINFLEGALYHKFNTSSLLTSQIDALPLEKTFFGMINSYGHTSETGVPLNASFFVTVYNTDNNGYRYAEITSVGGGVVYTNTKNGTTWGGWTAVPTRAEIVALNNSLTNNSMTPMSVLSGRGTALDGGYCLVGNMVHINWKFKAGTSATNSPSISSTPPSPKTEAALSCIDITSGISSAIDGSVPCGVSAVGTLYLKEIVNNHIYAITGTYIKL